MTGEVWISSVMNDHSLSTRSGARAKYYGKDWPPPTFDLREGPDVDMQAYRRYWRGETLAREELTEALFVFDKGRWAKRKDLFTAGSFYAVKGRLAEVLAAFDLGEGGLIEFPVYEEDKRTLVEGGPYYLLKFGCIKNTFVPEKSIGLRSRRTIEQDGYELWADYMNLKDGDIAVTRDALDGPDLWFEKKLQDRIFMSGRLHDAILAAKVNVDFRFSKARLLD
ncbi:MAG: hypothetical protein AAGF28_10230 [Pseudomonadota bacterium]